MAMTLSGAAMAADISNLSGQSCGTSSGNWHFVNNQVPNGSGIGTLNATWSSGDMCTVSASAVNQRVQHFNCVASGALQSASTNLGGKLVLSDFSCGPPKCEKDCEPPPPPPCDKDCK
jgi:hypothetical protein